MLQNLKIISAVLLLSISVTGCSSDDENGSPDSGEVKQEDRVEGQANQLSIVTYNLENLFDAKHDKSDSGEDKNDYQFLPLGHPEKEAGCMKSSPRYRKRCLNTDWTQETVLKKVEAIRKVLMEGSAPDVVAVQEVENAVVLEMLAEAMGPKYKSILEEGPDKRGIDVGMIYKEDKLTYKSHVSRSIVGDNFKSKPTRDVLTVFFEMKADTSKHKKTLAVYSNHWPSQAAPAPVRVATAEQVRDFIVADQAKYGENHLHVVLTGDFNVVNDDYPHPFHEVVYPFLTDVKDYAKKKKAKLNKQAFGTYFYIREMAWNQLDRIFVSENLIDGEGVELVGNSYETLDYNFVTQVFNYNQKGPSLLWLNSHRSS